MLNELEFSILIYPGRRNKIVEFCLTSEDFRGVCAVWKEDEHKLLSTKIFINDKLGYL